MEARPRVSCELTMVHDHGNIARMETVSASRFKATCLALIERVRRTGKPILVTKRGVPVAQLVPPPAPPPPASTFGCMAGTVREIGDLVEPLPEDDWEALH
jgi:prevent-host-death family protein